MNSCQSICHQILWVSPVPPSLPGNSAMPWWDSSGLCLIFPPSLSLKTSLQTLPFLYHPLYFSFLLMTHFRFVLKLPPIETAHNSNTQQPKFSIDESHSYCFSHWGNGLKAMMNYSKSRHLINVCSWAQSVLRNDDKASFWGLTDKVLPPSSTPMWQ